MGFPGSEPHRVFTEAIQPGYGRNPDDPDSQRVPYLRFPDGIGDVSARAEKGDVESDGLPFLDVDLSVDGGEWPEELTYNGEGVRLRICVNGKPVFRAFGLTTDIDATKEN